MVAQAVSDGTFTCSLCGVQLTNGPDLRDPRRAVVGHTTAVANGGGRLNGPDSWRWECQRCSTREGAEITNQRRAEAEHTKATLPLRLSPPPYDPALDPVGQQAGAVWRATGRRELPPPEFTDLLAPALAAWFADARRAEVEADAEYERTGWCEICQAYNQHTG